MGTRRYFFRLYFGTLRVSLRRLCRALDPRPAWLVATAQQEPPPGIPLMLVPVRSVRLPSQTTGPHPRLTVPGTPREPETEPPAREPALCEKGVRR